MFREMERDVRRKGVTRRAIEHDRDGGMDERGSETAVEAGKRNENI